jgi:hypothetical protein
MKSRAASVGRTPGPETPERAAPRRRPTA